MCQLKKQKNNLNSVNLEEIIDGESLSKMQDKIKYTQIKSKELEERDKQRLKSLFCMNEEQQLQQSGSLNNSGVAKKQMFVDLGLTDQLKQEQHYKLVKYGGIKPQLPKYEKVSEKFSGIVEKWFEINKNVLSNSSKQYYEQIMSHTQYQSPQSRALQLGLQQNTQPENTSQILNSNRNANTSNNNISRSSNQAHFKSQDQLMKPHLSNHASLFTDNSNFKKTPHN